MCVYFLLAATAAADDATAADATDAAAAETKGHSVGFWVDDDLGM